jgi:hypothetical protein
MATIQISGGSEKQNAWASKIASDWLAQLDYEINNLAARNDAALGWLMDNFQAARAKALEAFGKITAKQVIDLHTSARNPIKSMIAKARIKA